jgi:hypothetical protein
MKIKCFTFSPPETDTAFDVRPAPPERSWIDATPQRFAARCLPLLIANSHGWEILFKDSCEIIWNGGKRTEDIAITTQSGLKTFVMSHFGEGIVTFSIHCLFRTDPGVNLWIGGPVNYFKDGIQALTGIVETDWSPFTFTMNWKVTRPGQRIRFERGEPICHFFPVPRGIVDGVTTELASIESDSEVKRDFESARDARLQFLDGLAKNNPETVERGWQKEYFRGAFNSGGKAHAGHQTKINAKPFRPKP